MTILLPPGKTDPTGERCLRKSAVADVDPSAISSAVAMAAMLAGDPLRPGEDPEQVPLFRDPRSGCEISKDYATVRLRALLKRRFPALEARLHGLR